MVFCYEGQDSLLCFVSLEDGFRSFLEISQFWECVVNKVLRIASLRCFLNVVTFPSNVLFEEFVIRSLGASPLTKPCLALGTCKGGQIRDTETLNLSPNIVSLQVFVDVSRFSPCAINLSSNKNLCCGLKKVVAKSRALVYFEQQILALLLVFHHTHNLSHNNFPHARWKPGNIDPKPATKQGCATSWGFLYLVFRRLKNV